MRVIRYLLWVGIVVGPFLGYPTTVASLLLAVSYILYLKAINHSWEANSKYWEDTAISNYTRYSELLESNPEDARKVVESFHIDKLMRERK